MGEGWLAYEVERTSFIVRDVGHVVPAQIGSLGVLGMSMSVVVESLAHRTSELLISKCLVGCSSGGLCAFSAAREANVKAKETGSRRPIQ